MSTDFSFGEEEKIVVDFSLKNENKLNAYFSLKNQENNAISFGVPENQEINCGFSLKSGNEIKADFSFWYNELEHNKLAGRDKEDCHPISSITGLEEELNSKQAIIPDLEEIRQGAEKGKNALPSTTKYGSSLSLTINEQTYILTAQLKDQNGDNLGTAQTIDLPLETMVVGAEYDEDTKEVVLTLKNGQTVRFSIADLVSGLQPTLTAGNGINISENTVSNTGLTSATYDADNERITLMGG